VARGRSALATALALLAWTGCGDDSVGGPPPDAPAGILLVSKQLELGGQIQERYTCDGEGVSPGFVWTEPPAGTKSFAFLMEDPDAPDGTFVHWTVWDIPKAARGLDLGRVPAGAREGKNSFGDRGYGGPCPPEGDAAHRYVFYVYALGSRLGLDAGASPEDVRAAIADRAIQRGRLVGRYSR
jgi:Raf kinase inhibitor-like YbhB/YbcL family protein